MILRPGIDEPRCRGMIRQHKPEVAPLERPQQQGAGSRQSPAEAERSTAQGPSPPGPSPTRTPPGEGEPPTLASSIPWAVAPPLPGTMSSRIYVFRTKPMLTTTGAPALTRYDVFLSHNST